MATWCGLGPLLFRKKAYGLECHSSLPSSICHLGRWVCLKKTMRSSSYVFSKTYTKKPKLSKVARSKKSSRCKDNFVQMMELRKKIVILRDIIDLAPLERSASINELVVGTMEDLQKLYPEIISDIQYSEMKSTCIEQSLAYFCTALKSIGESWMMNHEWKDKSKFNLSSHQENASFNDIVQSVLATIDCIVSMANERFDMMEEYVNVKGSSYSRASSFGKSSRSTECCSETNSSCCSSPETPTSVLANFRNGQRISSEKKSSQKENVSCSSPLLWSLRVQAVEKLNPIDIKHLLLPKLSHCGVNVCPAPNAVAIVEESMINVDDKLTSKETDVADGNEEMEVSVTKDEKVLSRAASLKTDTNEEMVVNDIKEEKLNLSQASIEKDIVERTNDIDSHAAAIVEELPAPELPVVASKQSPLLPPVLPPPPPPPPPPCTPQPSVVALQLPTPPPPPPPMMRQTAVLSQQLSQPPPPPPLPPISALPAAAAPTAPPISALPAAAAPTAPPISALPAAAAPTAAPPPPPLSKVIEMLITAAAPPPPPPSNVTGMTIKAAGPPPPPPMKPSKGAPALASPPPMPQGNGLAPPPPPPGGALRSLRPKKSSTKLKRSHQLGNLYRTLKGKMEGSNQNLKAGNGRKGGAGNSNGGKQGMADALAEMTKRSAYFQQIEEDVRKYAASIKELKSSISSFQSTDMIDVLIFHRKVESVLEHLTDESQVLARFEGFPVKKLETIRTAAALYLKLDAIVNQLRNWKIVSPMGQLLDRVESYFSKIKGEVDALDRIKDDEAKRFKSHGIQFDFTILIRIKESMVDVSSNCMELALKEKRELKAAEKTQSTVQSETAKKGASKMLWKAFQFAYRVYTFAGGHDDRADRLTRELALEIESESHYL